jgi:hypothetical protein
MFFFIKEKRKIERRKMVATGWAATLLGVACEPIFFILFFFK